MKKQKKVVREDNRKQNVSLKHQPRDWKFWCMVALTVVWCGLFGVAMMNKAKKTSMPKWWAEQIKAEEKAKIPIASHGVEKSRFSIPYAKTGDYYQLSFDVLGSFPSDAPNLDNNNVKPKSPVIQVPPAVQELNGEKISVAGFMIPMITEKDQVNSFILAQTRGSCCYGLVPKLNQWIYVQMDQGKTAEILMDIPVTVFGILTVNKRFNPQDKDWCLYRMAGEKVELPRKTWF